MLVYVYCLGYWLCFAAICTLDNLTCLGGFWYCLVLVFGFRLLVPTLIIVGYWHLVFTMVRVLDLIVFSLRFGFGMLLWLG